MEFTKQLIGMDDRAAVCSVLFLFFSVLFLMPTSLEAFRAQSVAKTEREPPQLHVLSDDEREDVESVASANTVEDKQDATVSRNVQQTVAEIEDLKRKLIQLAANVDTVVQCVNEQSEAMERLKQSVDYGRIGFSKYDGMIAGIIQRIRKLEEPQTI